jgi:putative MATE family efflux protein
MFTQILGAVVNIILDPIFIFVFDWGIAGAAWATIISQFISFLWVMLYFNSGFTQLRFRLHDMKITLKLSLSILAIGFAPFAMQLAIGAINIILNHRLKKYGGELAIAAMGIVFSIFILMIMPLQGLNQGLQPIAGYNYGAKKYGRVKNSYKLAVKSATIFAIICFVIIQLFPEFLISIFSRKQDTELIAIASRTLMICAFMTPVVGFQIVTAHFFQALGKAKEGTLLSLSRQIIFLIPLVIFLPKLWGLGLNGVFLSFPLADLGAALLSFFVVLKQFKHLKEND